MKELNQRELKIWNLLEALKLPIMTISNLETAYKVTKQCVLLQSDISSFIKRIENDTEAINMAREMLEGWLAKIEVKDIDVEKVTSIKDAIIKELKGYETDVNPFKIEFDLEFDFERNMYLDQRLSREFATNIHVLHENEDYNKYFSDRLMRIREMNNRHIVK